jgi:mono/diheme cytochrome c family protein
MRQRHRRNPCRSQPRAARLVLLALLLAVPLGLAPSARGGDAQPPFDLTDEGAIREGAGIFRKTCSVVYCHGSAGRPGRGPRLRGLTFDTGYLYRTITLGRPGGMPAFKEVYSEAEIWKVIAYVQSLRGLED